MLAMVVNDNIGYLSPRGVCGFFASMLAPTAIGSNSRLAHDPLEAGLPAMGADRQHQFQP